MKMLQSRRKVCPQCEDRNAKLSALRKRLDYFWMALLFFPYRCRMCGIRFRRFV